MGSSVRSEFSTLGSAGRAAIAAMLCVLMVDQPLLAQSGQRSAPVVRVSQTRGQERVLHALNRLTFGPRPGEVAAVEAMGLNKWFEMQLNPAAIDDAKLDARLRQYPAMQMSMEELEARYPSPAKLRQLMNGKGQLPAGATQRALVEDQLAFYRLNKAKQEAASAAVAKAGNGGADAPGGMDAGGSGMTGAQRSDAPMQGQREGRQAQAKAGMDALAEAGALGGDTRMQDKPIPAGEISATPGMAAEPGDGSGRALAGRLESLQPEERMRAILSLSPKDVVKLRGSLQGAQLERLAAGMTPEERETLMALPGSLRMVALESMDSRVMRDVYSERQLEAVMTDFWLNHFNVYVRKNQNEPYLIPTYERETIRPRALGKFEDLLVATAKSPAMLVYLDNYRSVGPDSPQAGRLLKAQQMFPNAPLVKQASAGLNENYGRELMELHTLGVNGGYTQSDVTNVAKVFTGWGLAGKNAGGYQEGEFEFNERRHEPGSKTVLGKTIQDGGEREGLEVLHMLATSPATAHFISEKLAVRFVSDTPAPALVDRMAASFLKSNGDIKTVLRTMFQATEFWSAEVYRAKVKTPEEFVISAVRASGAEVNNPQALVQSLDKLGMPLYGMQTPNGYSWMKDGWVSTGALVSRMNFSLVLTGDRMPGTRTDWSALLGAEKTAGVLPTAYVAGESAVTAKERLLELLLLGQPVSEKTRATVLAELSDQNLTEQAATQFDLSGGGKGNYAGRGLDRMRGNAGPDDAQAAVMAGLLLGSPEFQRR